MKNVKEVTITVDGDKWQKALKGAFDKNKKNIKIDGFRKGAVTYDVYVKKAGVESLYMDASDIAIEEAFKEAVEQTEFDLVCEPSVNIEAIDKDKATFKFTMVGKPEVKLGKYKKLGIKKDEVKVSKKDIEEEMDHIRSHMAEMVVKENGEVVEGNTAVIDFVGTMDGVEFEGGKGEDYPLEIGSKMFIPGFEEAVVGMKKGETKDIDLKFPEDYTEQLKGKDVTFKVTVKEIKERVLPEYNKEFFEDLGEEGIETKEQFEAKVKEDLTKKKEDEAEDKYVNALLKAAVENMEVDINNEIIDAEVERMIREYSQQLQAQGMTFEQYLQFTGTKLEDVKSMMKPQAMARVQTRYLLEEIIDKEKVTVTEDEVKAEITSEATKYEVSEDEFLSFVGGKEAIEYELKMKKAVDIIKES